MVFISNAKNVAQSKWARTQPALLGIGTVLHITQWTKYINPLHAYESYIRPMANGQSYSLVLFRVLFKFRSACWFFILPGQRAQNFYRSDLSIITFFVLSLTLLCSWCVSGTTCCNWLLRKVISTLWSIY